MSKCKGRMLLPSKAKWAQFAVLLIVSVHCVASAHAQSSAVASICDSAASLASRESGVPLDVLMAITRTETGRKTKSGFAPWPWTVNMEGVGKWFEDVGSAQAYVDRHFARGARSFDVGCFQINYKWHNQAFGSIEEMFDPIQNARYAARFLSELYAEFGNWSRAAAAYHSRTPKYAKRYMTRFDSIRANLPEIFEPSPPGPVEQKPAVIVQAQVRVNTYPFLIASRRPSGASLVPIGNASVALIEGARRSSLLGSR